MADTTFSVTITMSTDTATKLAASASMLYAFKAVRCSDRSGLPLVWSVTSRLAPSMVVSWTAPYDGFTSTSDVVAGSVIPLSFQTSLPVGSTLTINNSIGTGVVTQNGTANACSIQNGTTTQFSCGLAQKLAGAGATGICAFPLYGNNLVTITPLDQVLLMFSTLTLAMNTAVTSLVAPPTDSLMVLAVTTGGVLVDLAGVTQRSLTYDINLGWGWGSAPWGKGVPASANLATVLIQPDLS